MHARRLISRMMHKGMLRSLAYLMIMAFLTLNARLHKIGHGSNNNPDKILSNLLRSKIVSSRINGQHANHVKDISQESSSFPRQGLLNKPWQAIVIVAGFRTGSSFVGELFNQHPNVFYFFEPLFYKFWNRTDKVSDGEVMKDLLLCNISSMHNAVLKTWQKMVKYYESSPSGILLTKLREIEHCINNGICFRHRSKKLCEPQLCQKNVSNRAACKANCLPVTQKMLEEECSKAKVRVIKVIRFGDILELKRSWSHPKIKLRVLHLTRDPRSSWLSRATVMTKSYADITAGTECKKDVKMYSAALTNSTKTSWLKEIYTLIRYEDVSEAPLKMALSIYKSLGFEELEMQKCIVDWIEMNTKATDHLTFGTSRNSAEQIYKWRRHIKMKDVKHVQEQCLEAMVHFGYTKIRDRARLKDFSVSLA